VRMEHLGLHWIDFREILYWMCLLKSVRNFRLGWTL